MSKNHARHVVGTCTEGHADADFVDALLDRLRSHSVNSDGAEEQREKAEESEQLREDAVRRVALGDEIVHGANRGDGLVGVHGPDGGANDGSSFGAGARAARDDGHLRAGELRGRDVNLAHWPIGEVEKFGVADDADDGADVVVVADFQLLA